MPLKTCAVHVKRLDRNVVLIMYKRFRDAAGKEKRRVVYCPFDKNCRRLFWKKEMVQLHGALAHPRESGITPPFICRQCDEPW